MNIINKLLQNVPSHFRILIKRLNYFVLGTVLTIFYAQLVHAQTPGDRPTTHTAYSPETIFVAVISAIITVFFLRNMYLVLTYASQTYGLEDNDDEVDESRENNALLFGAFSWVVGSAIVIASYGLGWGFLYIGPIICLLGPLVPIVAMEFDIKKYRQILAARAADRRRALQ